MILLTFGMNPLERMAAAAIKKINIFFQFYKKIYRSSLTKFRKVFLRALFFGGGERLDGLIFFY